MPELARVLRSGGLALHKAQAIRGALDGIQDYFGRLTLDPLRDWDDAACESFLTRLPFVGRKVARCVLMYSLKRQVFPATGMGASHPTGWHLLATRHGPNAGPDSPGTSFQPARQHGFAWPGLLHANESKLH